jgi:hypothetical protein
MAISLIIINLIKEKVTYNTNIIYFLSTLTCPSSFKIFWISEFWWYGMETIDGNHHCLIRDFILFYFFSLFEFIPFYAFCP